MHGLEPAGGEQTDNFPLYLANFFFSGGGIGDYICWFTALQWAYDTQPHCAGRTFSPEYVKPLLERLFPRWIHKTHEEYEKFFMSVPVLTSREPCYNNGHHMLDYGFTIFANLARPPEGYNSYVTIPPVSVEHLGLPPNYVVLNPCGTTVKTRTQTPESFNGFKDWLLSEGYAVVLLGASVFGNGPKIRETKPDEGYDFTGCFSLIDRTSLLEAQAVCAGAVAVCGIDSGIMHLACTSAVPVLWGYTIAGPQHREPRRFSGLHENLFPEISCQFCQSRTRYIDHDFGKCLLDHYECIKALSAERWIKGFRRLRARKADQTKDQTAQALLVKSLEHRGD